MARVTVEDCLDKVDSRFQLVLIAAKRARQLSHGVEPLVACENDKPTVIALREIADNKIDQTILDETVNLETEEGSAAEAALEEANLVIPTAEIAAPDDTPPATEAG